ncbi:dihydrofolate reductase [bacterium D16-51]|nr:dihydrofolate reductase [bacterium D16-59]RKI55673.1 dihydrofolate reductase [bacterium D16-51]
MNMIVCADSHWGIGKKGDLLVRIPADQRMFREHTMGNVVLGGRRTMEGLPGKMPLNGRVNIVLTSKKSYTFGDALIVHSMEEALSKLKKYEEDRIYIIGGGKVYQEFLPYCNRVYVTKVDYQYEADTFFPNLDESDEWVMTHDSEEQTYYDLEYYFTIYQRRNG